MQPQSKNKYNSTSDKTFQEFKLNPLDHSFHINPYPIFSYLREEDPLHRNLFGSWVITRYKDVKSMLQDKRIVADNLPDRIRTKSRALEREHKQLNALARITSKWLLYLEPPDHTRLRRMVSHVFTSTSIEKLRPKIQDIVDQLISRKASLREMDVINDFARPLPILVIASLLGIPVDEDSDIFQLANDISYIFDPLNPMETYLRMNESILQLEGYMKQIITEREKFPQDDLITELIKVRDGEDKLSTNELISLILLLFGTGEETTVNLIGNGTLSLLNNPEQLQILRKKPELIQSAVEETLRYESPVKAISKFAAESIDMYGKTIQPGDTVVLYLASANRDPDEFYYPDQLDITRTTNPHLAFSEGIHYCLGASLARVEGQIAIKALLLNFPDLKLLNSIAQWRNNISLRGLKTLPVSW